MGEYREGENGTLGQREGSGEMEEEGIGTTWLVKGQRINFQSHNIQKKSKLPHTTIVATYCGHDAILSSPVLHLSILLVLRVGETLY